MKAIFDLEILSRATWPIAVGLILLLKPAGGLGLTASSDIILGAVTLTMDELPTQPVDGLSFKGVTFHFTVAGLPDTDANYDSENGGELTFVQDPSLEGTTAGVLTLDFDSPTSFLDFGVALDVFDPLSPGCSVELFDVNLASLGITDVNTAPLISYSEAQFTYSGTPVRRAVITFSNAADRFAIDNLTFLPASTPAVITGTCLQPGTLGLEPCPAGTTVTAFLCADASCEALEAAGSSLTDTPGQFTLTLDSSSVSGRRLIIEAAIMDGGGGSAAALGTGAQSVMHLRSITFGPLAGGVRDEPVTPVTDAAVQLLEQNGIANYTDDRIQGVKDAVTEANASTNFAGQTIEQAVETAQATAIADQIVQARLACAVDCNIDGMVMVDELITGVNVALGLTLPDACLAGDSNGDGRITVAEIVDGVRRALTGCPIGAMSAERLPPSIESRPTVPP